MPSQSELNTFRRYIGDFGANKVADDDVAALLDDTTWDLTGYLATPITGFDLMAVQYHKEIIMKAALNWWTNYLGEMTERHSISVGSAASNTDSKWERALQMIQWLEGEYDKIQSLQIHIQIGNYSRYSKQTLRRIGGIEEEDTNA